MSNVTKILHFRAIPALYLQLWQHSFCEHPARPRAFWLMPAAQGTIRFLSNFQVIIENIHIIFGIGSKTAEPNTSDDTARIANRLLRIAHFLFIINDKCNT